MRKNYILLFLAALLAPLGAKAQITEFPYILDFENGLDGWTVIDADGDGYNWEVSSSTDGIPSHSGSAMATSRSYSTSYVALTPDNWLVSPAIVLDNTVRQLSWWHHTQDPSYPAEHYAVYISTTGNTVADFTDEPVYETTLTAADNEYNIHQVMLNGYEGETIYIAFRHYNCTDMFYFHLDDISIEAAPNCLPPENLAFENITTTGADMTFDMPACATDGVRFLINGEEQPVLTSGSYSFTNLEPGTVYTIHLYSLCGDGDTSYATTAQFMTECENITLPYLFDFEGDHANCYNYEHMYWRTEASNAHSGNIAFYSGGSTGHYVVTPVIEAPEDADGNIVFEFYALPLNSTYYGTDVTFKLYVST
ncbi:MAG: choice-of-anchor J domain-containing protein [Bacteroidales bacterium]|nr:choice-of-anchor J domain-containing protein [Bacteroidales bacterium]